MTLLRKRELLLSLKYSTIEGCFSVPMLTLTASNLAFCIGFAVEVLGWGPVGIGWMAATPQFCYFLQPPITHFLQKRFSMYQIMRIGFVLGALPWFFIWAFPMFGEKMHLAFALVVLIASFGNSIAGVSWSTAISDVVPLSIRGKYFGRRNLVYGFWTLLIVLAAGEYVTLQKNSIATFGSIFFVAGLARLLGLFFLTRMKFPHRITEKHPHAARVADYAAVLKDRNYLTLILFVGLWSLCLGLGTPFYTVYILKALPMTMSNLMVLNTLSGIGALISYNTWGILSDQHGNKPVFFTCTTVLASVAFLAWLLVSPVHYHHLYFTYFVMGCMTGGYQLCQFNLMIKLVPEDKKAHYISVFYAITSLMAGVGPLLGGKILSMLPEEVGTFMGQPFLKYQVLFAGSLLIGLLCTLIIFRIREPAERPWLELVRVMRGMRAFNPVLGLGSLAELMLTPRTVVRVVREYMRTLRRQKSAVADVGNEIVGVGWRVLKNKFSKDR